MGINLTEFSLTQWLAEMWKIILYPLGDGFYNHIALVCVIIMVSFTMGAIVSKLGTDPDAPFEL